MRRGFRSDAGQTSTEMMLLISVVVVAVVAAAYTFVPVFQQGVQRLAADVQSILDNGTVGGTGLARNGSAGNPGNANVGHTGDPDMTANGLSGDGIPGNGLSGLVDNVDKWSDAGSTHTVSGAIGHVDPGPGSGDPGVGNGSVGNHNTDPNHNNGATQPTTN